MKMGNGFAWGGGAGMRGFGVPPAAAATAAIAAAICEGPGGAAGGPAKESGPLEAGGPALLTPPSNGFGG